MQGQNEKSVQTEGDDWCLDFGAVRLLNRLLKRGPKGPLPLFTRRVEFVQVA